MADDHIGGGYRETAATRAATDQQPNLDRAATCLSAQARRDRHRWPSRNGDYRRQLWHVMPMRWLLLGWLLGWLLCRRLDRTAGRRCRRLSCGRRRCGGGAGRRGRAGTGDVANALLPLQQLHEAVNDQRDENQNRQGPANEHHGFAIPRGWLGYLVEQVPVGFVLLRRSLPRLLISRGRFTRWRLFNHAEVDMARRLLMEVVRWAIACHGTDGTDPSPRHQSRSLTRLRARASRLDCPRLVFGGQSCSNLECDGGRRWKSCRWVRALPRNCAE
jgi:hypothetical protein